MPTRQPAPPESRGMPKLPPNDGQPEQSVFYPSRLDDLHRVSPTYDFTRFNELLESLQKWRSTDHEDNLVLCRSYVIEIIEGVKALRDTR
jgi:hypothetical protein